MHALRLSAVGSALGDPVAIGDLDHLCETAPCAVPGPTVSI